MTNDFVLDPRLAADCFVLGDLDDSLLLLMNNARVPWMILVPRVEVDELHELEASQRQALLASACDVASFIKDEFPVEKMNVASIGNIVRQLHVHIVGRDASDYCWPGVVWGAQGGCAYADGEPGSIVERLKQRFPDRFRALPPG